MGIKSPLDAVPSITLGTSGVTPLEMANAYATLAAGGIYHRPQAIVKVVLPNGRVDWKPKTKGKRAIPAGVASVVTHCLERVASAGTGSATGSYFPYPRAGKTGTTENGWDVWYVGYTPNLAASVWMGDAEKNSPMDGAYGGTYCAPMWAKFFAAALKDQKHPAFRRHAVDLQRLARQDAGCRRRPRRRPPSAAPRRHRARRRRSSRRVQPTPTPTTPKPTPPRPRRRRPRQPTPTQPPPTPTSHARRGDRGDELGRRRRWPAAQVAGGSSGLHSPGRAAVRKALANPSSGMRCVIMSVTCTVPWASNSSAWRLSSGAAP